MSQDKLRKKLEKKIHAYAEKHNFHMLFMQMTTAAFSAKSEDPVKFMIEYLLEKDGSSMKEYANEKLKKEIERKEEMIKAEEDSEKSEFLSKLSLKETNSSLSNLIGSQTVENFLNNAALSDFKLLSTQVVAETLGENISLNSSSSGNLVINESYTKQESQDAQKMEVDDTIPATGIKVENSKESFSDADFEPNYEP